MCVLNYKFSRMVWFFLGILVENDLFNYVAITHTNTNMTSFHLILTIVRFFLSDVRASTTFLVMQNENWFKGWHLLGKLKVFFKTIEKVFF